jgi:arylformamidase
MQHWRANEMNWETMSRAARDAAYSNTGAVANSIELIAQFAAASARFRAAHPQYLDCRYGPRERNAWDLFPADDRNAPCIVFIHGGYWQRNSKEAMAGLVAGPYARGWSAALLGYTLAPDASMREIVGEINSALDWLGANGPTYGITGPVVLSGWSAGGHLTAMCLDHPLVCAGLAISGLFELGPIRDTELNLKLQLSDEEIALLSPLRLAVVQKPLLIAYGTAELTALVADSRNFHAYRSDAHAPGALLPVPAANHFTIMHELVDAKGLLTRYALMLP